MINFIVILVNYQLIIDDQQDIQKSFAKSTINFFLRNNLINVTKQLKGLFLKALCKLNKWVFMQKGTVLRKITFIILPMVSTKSCRKV